MSAQMPATQERQAISLFQREIVGRALIDSFKKLDPRVQVRNPVMFVVEIGSVITTVTWLIQAFGGKPLGGGHEPGWYTLTIAIWLWLTVVFANMAGVRGGPRPRAGGHAEIDAQGDRREDARRRHEGGLGADPRGHGGRGGRRADPGRWNGDRGDRDG